MAGPTFRIPLAIDFNGITAATPVRVSMDFTASCGVVDQLIDPHTIAVKRRVGRRVTTFLVQFDERLYYQNQGWVSWLVADPTTAGEWWMVCRARAGDGSLAPAPPLPPVGTAEELCCSGSRWQPIRNPGTGSFPIPVDWTGDGRIDILSSSGHSNAVDMPWGGIFCWRNIGTNQRPRYSQPWRLAADGVRFCDSPASMSTDAVPGKASNSPQHAFISEDYIRCDTFDWFGTGRADLITASRQGGIQVYRNTGTLDDTGMPRLEQAYQMALPSCLTHGRWPKIRVVDWDGSGRPSLLVGVRTRLVAGAYYKCTAHLGQIMLLRNVGSSRKKPRFEPVIFPTTEMPISASERDPMTMQNISDDRCLSFDLYDIDGDGVDELFFCHPYNRDGPIIEMWRNVGDLERPLWNFEGHLPWSREAMAFGFRFVSNAAFDGCLMGGWYAGTSVRYFRRRGNNPFAAGAYTDTGPLLGEAAKVKVDGFAGPSVYEGAADTVLVSGDDAGFIAQIRHEKSRTGLKFEVPCKVTDREGIPARFHREAIFHDNDGESYVGQAKPFLCDWDEDGKLDIIVGNNTNRLFWLQAYDPKKNSYQHCRELRVRGMHAPFAFRTGPAVACFGRRPVLIGVDRGNRVCFFRQGRGSDRLTLLQKPEPLPRQDGGVFMKHEFIPPHLRELLAHKAPLRLAACDWTGNGVLDLVVSSNWWTSLLENVGSNAKPIFRSPQPFAGPDGPLVISHHECNVTIWDWDGDGRPDLVIGGESGSLYMVHREWVSGRQPHATAAVPR